jgi:hypothetical protein
MLFRVCRDERQQRWIVLVEGRLYGEYLDKEEAILDAVEAATDARASGNEAEVLGPDPDIATLLTVVAVE